MIRLPRTLRDQARCHDGNRVGHLARWGICWAIMWRGGGRTIVNRAMIEANAKRRRKRENELARKRDFTKWKMQR